MYSHWSLHPARIKYREFMRLFEEMSRYRVELEFRELYWVASKYQTRGQFIRFIMATSRELQMPWKQPHRKRRFRKGKAIA
jgi:hypothetical protein